MIRWTIAIALGIGVAWLAYARSTAPEHRARVLLLALMRGLAVMLVAALLFSAPSALSKPSMPLVAIDASASWRRAQGDDSTALRALRTVWSAAASQSDATVLVGDSLRVVGNADVASLTPRDGASRVRLAVDRAAALGRPLLLVTDGEVDDPESMSDAPSGSAVRVPTRNARRDVALADLTVPPAAAAGDTLPVLAVVVAGAVATPAGTLQFTLDGAPAGSVAVPALGAFATTRVALSVPLPRGAHITLLRGVLQVAGDVEPRNDTLTAAIEVGDKTPAVFVSTAPDLDVREVLVVLRGALALPTRAYLRIAPDVWREEGSLAPIRESDVRARAAAAGILIVHGDTSWAPKRGDGKGADVMRGARALWSPAPATALARAGENARAAEWYVHGAPVSPLSAALSGLPWDSLPPLTLAGVPRGGVTVIDVKLGKTGEATPAIVARDDGGARTLVISGSGYAGWSLRGGRSLEAFTALWGTVFDWLAVGRGDQRAARPSTSWIRNGDPVRWRRGGSDSVATAVVTKRGADAAQSVSDTVHIAFAPGSAEAVTSTREPGIYDIKSAGGSSVLVVNASREWVPRAPNLKETTGAHGAFTSDAPRLSDAWWPFVAALLLLCGEWVGRRLVGLR